MRKHSQFRMLSVLHSYVKNTTMSIRGTSIFITKCFVTWTAEKIHIQSCYFSTFKEYWRETLSLILQHFGKTVLWGSHSSFVRLNDSTSDSPLSGDRLPKELRTRLSSLRLGSLNQAHSQPLYAPSRVERLRWWHCFIPVLWRREKSVSMPRDGVPDKETFVL